MEIMSELRKPEPQEEKKRTLSRRDFLGVSAAATIVGGIGLIGYTDYEKDALEPQIAPSRTIEGQSPSVMGSTSRIQSEVYDEHHIPLQENISNGLIGLGGLAMAAYLVDKYIVEPIKVERALYENPKVTPDSTNTDNS